MSTGTPWAPDLGVHGTQLPAGDTVGMAASEAPEEHDIILLNSSGYGVVADGTQVNLRAAGIMYPDKRTTTSTTAGRNVVRVWDGVGARMPMKSGDELTANDICVPVYISDNKEIAKTAYAAGVGRSILGLALGLDEEAEAVFWAGPVGQLLARASLAADYNAFARYAIADASASTAISERVIGRVLVPGVVTSVAYTGAAFTADNSDYATGTIAKRGAADAYAAATTIATFDSRAANQGAATAFTPYAWALSGTAANIRLIPGDVLTLVTTKAASGKTLSGSIDVFGKVI